MPKSVPKNGFYFFMKEKQEEYRQRGLNYIMSRIAEIAAPLWTELTKEERMPYEEMAKEDKMVRKVRNGGKLDCTGKLISDVEREARDEKRKEFEMKSFIEKTIGVMSDKDCAEEHYHFISTQAFCCTSDGLYLPAEIAVVKYSIANGITKEYQAFLAPGPVPLGYRFSCQENSDRTHKIPLDFEFAKSDYTEVVQKIHELIDSDEEETILYCFTDELKQTNYILNRFLMKNVDPSQRQKYKIYDICHLMGQLYGRFATYSVSVIQNEWLRSTTFCYKPGTCCSWHWDNEVYVCSLGIVKCFCYIFSDHLCELYGVDVIPGRHFPATNEGKLLSGSASICSGASDYSSSYGASIKGDRTLSTGNLESSGYGNRSAGDDTSNDLDSFAYQCSMDGRSESYWETASNVSCASDRSRLTSVSAYSGKSFASAAKSEKSAPYLFGENDFPELGGSSRMASTAPSNDDTPSNIGSSVEAKKAMLRDGRGLGRGKFFKASIASGANSEPDISVGSKTSISSSSSEYQQALGRGRRNYRR